MKTILKRTFYQLLILNLYIIQFNKCNCSGLQDLTLYPVRFKPVGHHWLNTRLPNGTEMLNSGIWAHWGPQCEPEFGDWYARNMYIQGHSQYNFHNQKYGHPSVFGFKDVINEWKADQWDPEYLVNLYKSAGAKYFVGMGVHHDNFDLWNSTFQPWNSVNLGPKKDIIGGWAAAAQKAGLRFGVTIHALVVPGHGTKLLN